MIRAEEARAELARRELARRHFVDFECYVAPYYRPAKHHRLVADYLEMVETFVRTRGATGIGRLLILEPPRHGKSEQASRHFPAWVLGRNPDVRIMAASYGADLATKFSRAARDILRGEAFGALFGDLAGKEEAVALSEDSKSVQAWDLAAPNRGGMMAAGVGGAMTGMGANLMIVDDPFKNREESESEERRNSVWEWWTSTAYTRLEEGGAVIGMLTRWHADDWAGRLLKAMASDEKADRWVVLNLPAIYEPVEVEEGKDWGEYQLDMLMEGVWVDREDALGRQAGMALWPEKYNEEDLERIAANVGDYDFASLYQQWPYQREGSKFKREWFAIVDEGPRAEEIIARVRVWDKAGTKTGLGGDYSAGALMCLTKSERIYVEHMARGQYTPMGREQMILTTAQRDAERAGMAAVIWHQQDPGSAGLDSAQATNRMLAKHGFTAHFETMTGDKEVRAGPWSSACEGGQVLLVRGGWNRAFVDEHVAFPKGKYDDQVDVASMGYSKLMGKRKLKDARSYQG